MSYSVVGFQFTNASKARVIESLALAFEQRQITLIPDPTLIAELQAFSAERLPGGLLRYSAPDSLHDDCVMALALAMEAANQPSWLVWDK